MEKTIIKYKDLPFEVDKVYQTKFQTGDKVLLKKINMNDKGKVIGFGVIYEKHEHLGVCPLGADQLIPDRVEDGKVSVCGKCGEPL